jgi:hypothetical protein
MLMIADELGAIGKPLPATIWEEFGKSVGC